jgi:hypothetical protein
MLDWVGTFLNRWSRQQDETGDPALAAKMETYERSGPRSVRSYGDIRLFDWVMSLEPHWFSTVFGLSFMVGQVLTAFPFAIADDGLSVEP